MNVDETHHPRWFCGRRLVSKIFVKLRMSMGLTAQICGATFVTEINDPRWARHIAVIHVLALILGLLRMRNKVSPAHWTSCSNNTIISVHKRSFYRRYYLFSIKNELQSLWIFLCIFAVPSYATVLYCLGVIDHGSLLLGLGFSSGARSIRAGHNFLPKLQIDVHGTAVITFFPAALRGLIRHPQLLEWWCIASKVPCLRHRVFVADSTMFSAVDVTLAAEVTNQDSQQIFFWTLPSQTKTQMFSFDQRAQICSGGSSLPLQRCPDFRCVFGSFRATGANLLCFFWNDIIFDAPKSVTLSFSLNTLSMCYKLIWLVWIHFLGNHQIRHIIRTR